MSRLKVVHAAKFYPPVRGGIETVVADLCDGTADCWDVRVVAASRSRRTTYERRGGVDLVRVGAYGIVSSVPLCPSLPRHLWRSRADCVVLHEPNPIAGLAAAVHRPARRLVIWHHSDLVRPWWAPPTYGRLQRALYRRADCVIVSSPRLADSTLVGSARRVEVIPFGIDVGRYRAADASRVRDLASRVEGPRVLFVGRLVYYKGAAVLIDAMASCPGSLVLVGDGPLEAELRRRAADRGVLDRILFAGRVSDDDLVAYYRAADVLVLPSVARSETFGVVQVEAMAAGLPVISTDLPTGVPWVNQDGVTGLVVPPGDAPALAAALNALLGDPALRARLGQNGAARAAALFDRRTMVETFRRVVEQVVDRATCAESSRAVRVEAG